MSSLICQAQSELLSSVVSHLHITAGMGCISGSREESEVYEEEKQKVEWKGLWRISRDVVWSKVIRATWVYALVTNVNPSVTGLKMSGIRMTEKDREK